MARLTDDPVFAQAWRRALDLWGVPFHAPVAPPRPGQAIAWFGFPPEIVVDRDRVADLGLDSHLESVLAHELGHHVLAPGTRLDSLKVVAQCARALAASAPRTVPRDAAPELANLWTDLLVNTRVVELQRRAAPDREPDMVALWRGLARRNRPDALWWVLYRADELLWHLPDGTLCRRDPPRVPSVGEGDEAALLAVDPAVDARLLADTARTFARDAVSGALAAAMVLAPYLLRRSRATGAGLCDGEPGSPSATAGEAEQVLGDPRLRQVPRHPAAGEPHTDPAADAAGGAGQDLQPAQTLELFPGADPDAVIAAWYLTRARTRLVRVVEPAVGPSASEEVPGALEAWLPGDPVERIDWSGTLARGPVIVPGVTTMQRESTAEEPPRAARPIELELYVDSSGSMPTPAQGSAAVLAGAILVLSVLRSGGRVRVTSFSGAGQVAGGQRASRDRTGALGDLLTSFGGGTSFPLDLFAQRAAERRIGARRHLVVLSDDGLTSMFGAGQEGREHVAAEARPAFETATLLLLDPHRLAGDAPIAAGYDVRYLDRLEDAPAECARLAEAIARG